MRLQRVLLRRVRLHICARSKAWRQTLEHALEKRRGRCTAAQEELDEDDDYLQGDYFDDDEDYGDPDDDGGDEAYY